jgi:hypothetical protein
MLAVSQHAHQELVMSHDQDASSKAVLGYCNPLRAVVERQIVNSLIQPEIGFGTKALAIRKLDLGIDDNFCRDKAHPPFRSGVRH